MNEQKTIENIMEHHGCRNLECGNCFYYTGKECKIHRDITPYDYVQTKLKIEKMKEILS